MTYYEDFTRNLLKRKSLLENCNTPDRIRKRKEKKHGVDNPGELFLGRSESGKYFWKGGYYLPYETMEEHTLIVGATGAGKTIMMRPDWLHACNLLGKTPGLIVGFDYKGEDYPFYARQAELQNVPFYYYNPTDARSDIWNVAADLGHDLDLVKDFVATIIPDNQTQEPFWNQCARMLLFSCVMTLLQTKGVTWGMADLYNLTQQSLPNLIEYLLIAPSNFAVVEQMLNARADKTVDSIRLNLLAMIDSVRTAARFEYYGNQGFYGTGRTFSIKEVAKKGGLLLFGQDLQKIETCRPLMRVAFTTIAKVLLSSDEKLHSSDHFHTSIFIDEFNKYSQGREGLPFIMDLLTAGRSKKVTLTIACQDLVQLEAGYGVHAPSLINSCELAIFMKSNANKDADAKSKELGLEERLNAEYTSNGHTTNIRAAYKPEPAFMPEYFKKMPKASKKAGINFVWRSDSRINQRCLQWDDLMSIQPLKKENCPNSVPIPLEYTIMPQPWEPDFSNPFSPSVQSKNSSSSQKENFSAQPTSRKPAPDTNATTAKKAIELQRMAQEAKKLSDHYMQQFAQLYADSSFDNLLKLIPSPGSVQIEGGQE